MLEASSSEEMFDKERELVELGDHSYNLKGGGSGGFDYIIQNKLNKNHTLTREDRCKGRQTTKRKELVSLAHKRGNFSKAYFKSKDDRAILAQSEDARKKRKETMKQKGHSQGERNSQFGTIWITDDRVNRKIKKTDPIPEGWRKGRRINGSLAQW